ncbi:hypothetical protein [Streptomyces sp. JW3]|uniref:hypothetical protein n=1 Tax=Streptomyces sp. JW3 TaxID=3456955 RepID=UPI003FA49822
MRRRWNGALGRLLLALAVLLERSMAGERATTRWKTRRNTALQAAHRRGVPVEALATRLELTPKWVRDVVGDPRKAAVAETGRPRGRRARPPG